MNGDLELALALTDAADAVTLPRFRAADLRVSSKRDLTPVTDADHAAERALVSLLAVERPRDAVLAEEAGASGDSRRRWILDPIDGTRNFSRGIPIWATLVALEEEGETVVAAVSAPALGRRWWAVRGGGGYADGSRLRVSAVERLEDATVSAEQWDEPAWHVRNLGDFWQHMLVAEGAVDVAVDPATEVWDTAAPALIVEEAGGRVSRLADCTVSTNGRLHGRALDATGGIRKKTRSWRRRFADVIPDRPR